MLSSNTWYLQIFQQKPKCAILRPHITWFYQTITALLLDAGLYVPCWSHVLEYNGCFSLGGDGNRGFPAKSKYFSRIKPKCKWWLGQSFDVPIASSCSPWLHDNLSLVISIQCHSITIPFSSRQFGVLFHWSSTYVDLLSGKSTVRWTKFASIRDSIIPKDFSCKWSQFFLLKEEKHILSTNNLTNWNLGFPNHESFIEILIWLDTCCCACSASPCH